MKTDCLSCSKFEKDEAVGFENSIAKALDVILSEGKFSLERIIYDEQNFGNIYIVLSSKDMINIRFVRDRGTFKCDMGHAGEWYSMEDVFEVIGITFSNDQNEFLDYVAGTVFLIESHLALILNMFSPSNVKKTILKLEEMGITRANRLFYFRE